MRGASLNLKVADAQHRSRQEVDTPSPSLTRDAGSVSGLTVRSEWGSVDLLEKIADEWRQLCQEGRFDAPFYRPEWIASAIRAFASRQRVLLITARNGSRLRAVLPLIESKGRASAIAGARLRSASLIPRFDFVHGEGPDAADAVQAVWKHLRDLPGWGAIELVNVPEGSAAERLLGAAKEDGFPTCQHEYARSPYIVLNGQTAPGDFSRFGRSSRFRYHLRQGWREMSKKGQLRVRRVEKVDAETLQVFYRLEQRGWKGKKGTAIACSAEMRVFYDAVVRAAEQFGYLSMYFLDLGDATIAAHLAFTYGGHYYPVKVAYDESFSAYGPGHLIIARVLEDCVTRGLTEFDCLGDWTDAKAKWTEKVRSHSYCGIFRDSSVGHILCAETLLHHHVQQTAFQVLRPIVQKARIYIAQLKNKSSQRPNRNADSQKAQQKP
jgi:CelD/BcsL family acetyltransferase involved in cellulose biosynthesis